MRAVFISYRREDVEGHAGRLFQDLATQFGKDAIFMDVAGIEPGRDFRKVIDHQVASCGVLLALIGKTWLDSKNDAGLRRLEDPADFVRLETAAALKRDIPVIPILVHGGKMPRAEDLPEDLKDLAYRNAVELTHARWQSDVQLLITALRPYVGSPENKAVTSDAASGPAVHPGPSDVGSDSPASRGSSPGDVVPAATVSQTVTVPWRSILLAGIAAVAVAAGGYVAYESFSAQKAEKVATEKATADKATADKATADKATAEKATAEKATAEKATADKATADKATADKATADKATAAKATADKATADKANADKATAAKATAAKATADKAAADRTAGAAAQAAEKAAADKVAATKAVADRAAATEGVDSPQAVAARIAANRAAVEQALQKAGSKAHSVTLVKLDPSSNSTLRHHQTVTVLFSYTTTAPGGVRVFVSPMVGLSRVADYSASTSKLLPTGNGTGEETFRVRSGSPPVDGIELRMTTDTQREPLFHTIVPVRYRFEGEAEVLTAQQLKMRTCSEQARTLKGGDDERRRYMSDCLR